MCDSHNSIDSIGSIDCIDSIDSIESEDSTDSIDSIDFIDSIDSILVPHKRPPTFTPHTKGRALRARANNSTDGGGAFGAAPIGTVVFPFVCGVNVGGLLCGTSIESIESINSIESIESVESSDSIESIKSIL